MHIADSDRLQPSQPAADPTVGDRRSDPVADIDLIFRLAPVGLLLLRDQRIARANAAMEALFGCEVGELCERRQSFAHPADRLLIASLSERCLECADAGGEFELYLYRRRGEPVWVSVRGTIIDRERPEAGCVFAFTDIDVRRRAAEADSRSRVLEELSQTRRYLDRLIEVLPVAVAVRDRESGRFSAINPAGERLLGLPRQRIVGRNWHEIYGKRFAFLFAEMDRLAIAGSEVVERKGVPLLRADGEVRRVDYRVLSIEGGTPDGCGLVASIIEDRTEHLRLFDALQDTEGRLRQLAESIDQFIFVAPADFHRILYSNGRLEALVGVESDAVKDDLQRLRLVVAEADLAEFDRRWRRRWAALRRMRKVEFTIRVQHPRRGERWLSVRLHPARVSHGETRIFGVAEDVTAQWLAQRQQFEDAVAQRDVLLRELHDRIGHHLSGVASMLRQMGAARPELALLLEEIAGQVETVGSVHGVQHGSAERAPVLDLVQGICAQVSERGDASVHFESEDPELWNWGLPEGEAVALALVMHELCELAVRHRVHPDAEVSVVACAQPNGLVIDLRYDGAPPVDVPPEASGVALRGLVLVRSLLPRRGSLLKVLRDGAGVRLRLLLREPALYNLRDEFSS